MCVSIVAIVRVIRVYMFNEIAEVCCRSSYFYTRTVELSLPNTYFIFILSVIAA